MQHVMVFNLSCSHNSSSSAFFQVACLVQIERFWNKNNTSHSLPTNFLRVIKTTTFQLKEKKEQQEHPNTKMMLLQILIVIG